MTQQVINLSISFEALVDAVAELPLKEKRQLWELLNKQVTQVETETMEEGSTVEAEIQETPVAYQIENLLTVDEPAAQLKQKITSLLDVLSEAKLPVVFDFVQFLAEQEQDLQAAWLNTQSQSAAYQEWIGSDNDIYDEVFADVDPAR